MDGLSPKRMPQKDLGVFLKFSKNLGKNKFLPYSSIVNELGFLIKKCFESNFIRSIDNSSNAF